MRDKLLELAENINDEESFLLFVKELVRDREEAVKKEKANLHHPMVQMRVAGKILQSNII